jgi:hypothetical protein
VGSEKGSKLMFFAGLRIRNDVDEMGLVWCGVKACATNCFRSLKETKRPLFGPFWGTYKMGSFYPPLSGGV